MDNQKHHHIMHLRDLTIGYRSQGFQNAFIYGPVNLKIHSGDLIAIIGRNGIGKSSLLRTLARLQNPLEGHVMLFGQESNHYNRLELAKIMSYVSTEIIGMQNLKVYEVVSLGRFPYTNWLGKLNHNDNEIIENAIDQAQIRHLSAKFLHQLSDGERQKTMIARALAQDTPVIVLDEPTAFLDLPSRYDILQLMNSLTTKSGKTIVFSTHDLDIAMHEADKIWLMTNEGIIDGAPEDLLFKQQFHKLFINSSLEFDHRSDGFRLKKELYRYIGLKGKQDQAYYTEKALKRIGFQATDKMLNNLSVEIVSDAHEPVWMLKEGTVRKIFNSIYELITYLKNNYKS